ncbi:Gfo/Idh/MocA family oxidoreductase [Allomuricauda sp. SCSIO 65647]|uniref:Gfo/Idh/MocA family oxidoreductase n=1 Tax=Allomuricauda sp. SCSIO 65647 TaxID=2908843 RepID=UPI001F179FDD|nr:Gfo/Idh/MocA family oxidoreductase [Muricauda sp. SCSIO 65647]UJH68595.1 Gfo/Idh/MocA family oxidoreductase [Muricauda sp. SCSIO 65647]
MANPIRTGVLSFGLSGTVFHSPFLNEHPGFELTGIVERTIKKAHKSYPKIRSYDSVTAIIEDADIELIIVNTPNSTHFAFASQALKAGKHVVLEKPFTITSKEAKKLFALALENDRCIMPYQNRRYDSDFLSVKQVVESGKLGNLIEAHFRYDRYRYAIGTNIAKETNVPGSGVLYNLGPHLLDGVISLFGVPEKWKKTMGQFRPGTLVDDYAHIHLSYPDNLQVHITTSLLVADPGPAFVIYGTKGSYKKNRADVQEQQLMMGMKPKDLRYGIEEPDQKGILTLISEAGEKNQTEVVSERSSYIDVFEDVYQTIRKGRPYPVTETQIIQQLEILEA